MSFFAVNSIAYTCDDVNIRLDNLEMNSIDNQAVIVTDLGNKYVIT